MAGNELSDTEVTKWDPTFTEFLINAVTPVINRWFRPEVRGLETFPSTGGALLVSNHSGGVLTPDWNVLAPALYGKFGYDRPLYTLAHYGVFFTPFRAALGRLGVIHASRENAEEVLRSGAVVLAFPGGDYDAFRPTLHQRAYRLRRPHRIRQDRHQRRRADRARGVDRRSGNPALPHPRELARKAIGTQANPDGDPAGDLGVPFGLTVFFPANLPLPSKIVYQVLEPIDVVARFGEDADVDEVDAHVRSVMQSALDRLGRERRLPVLG